MTEFLSTMVMAMMRMFLMMIHMGMSMVVVALMMILMMVSVVVLAMMMVSMMSMMFIVVKSMVSIGVKVNMSRILVSSSWFVGLYLSSESMVVSYVVDFSVNSPMISEALASLYMPMTISMFVSVLRSMMILYIISEFVRLGRRMMLL
ncbi:hypothetical protein CDAR_571141 [Caerostris darwini]|uniref:NADH dehydrogenase subunit 6 n=1 Tax=Caerostris darwini TaxID=1538125 RepID=A0AAV4SIX4_9ARAC|nr:hypothetical protein CDAR_571141 [Caerostris darwini]